MVTRNRFRSPLLALLALGALLATAAPAAAHAELLGTEPPYSAVLGTAPSRVLIRYDVAVEVAGAQVTLERSGTPIGVAPPVYASDDRKDIAIPLPSLGEGTYLLTWFLFGSDGDVMGAELAFTVTSTGAPESPVTASPSAPAVAQPAFAPLARAQDASRLAASAGVILVVGGIAFLALLWRGGARLARSRALLWGALVTAIVANAAALGLKGAAVQGRSALAAFTPGALTALEGTHVGRVLTLRLAFLLLTVPVVALLTAAPERALRSHRWVIGAGVCALGALGTHGMLSHAYARGPLAWVMHVVHLGAVAVWLGGLAVLATVVLPRRRREELAVLVPRWSRLAFASVATAAIAGPALLVLISPRWSAMPASEYGRILFVKLVLVAAMLGAASRSRRFVQQRLPALVASSPVRGNRAGDGAVPVTADVLVSAGVAGTPAASAPPAVSVPALPHSPDDLDRNTPGACRAEVVDVDRVPLRPFVTAVTAELCLAASILGATAVLVGRSPPG